MNKIVLASCNNYSRPEDRAHHDVRKLCGYNIDLLKQMSGLIESMQQKAFAGFNYAQAVGPHFRHVIEHYAALLTTLAQGSFCVDYDTRERNVELQNIPALTLAKIQELIEQFESLVSQKSFEPGLPLTTRLRSGLSGEDIMTADSSLARELLFVASHALHHFAFVDHHCRQAGVELGRDFGKAPSTIAFERGA